MLIAKEPDKRDHCLFFKCIELQSIGRAKADRDLTFYLVCALWREKADMFSVFRTRLLLNLADTLLGSSRKHSPGFSAILP